MIQDKGRYNCNLRWIKEYCGVFMKQRNSSFTIERTCTVCGYIETIDQVKPESFVGLIAICKAHTEICKQCSSRLITVMYREYRLTFELLKEWGLNSDIYLSAQDEELILADEMYLDIILEVLDTVVILDHKRDLLMESLCIIVYDNTVMENLQKDERLKKRVIEELNKRKDKLQLADYNIMNYIKDIVYPQLDYEST